VNGKNRSNRKGQSDAEILYEKEVENAV